MITACHSCSIKKVVKPPAAIARLSHPDLTLSAPSRCVDTHRVPHIWEQQIPQPPFFPIAAEAMGLMGTAYLCPVRYPIVDTNRYPRNENILLLLTLTLAYMDLHL